MFTFDNSHSSRDDLCIQNQDARSRTMSDGEVSEYARSIGRRGFARRRDLICWATTICEKTWSSGVSG
ncbi:hypothetical protein BVRB_6g150610 [Beta vulgaris subsp. vulgaris]|nr:hypothetical protein BVRB_6g150610 [Beta vulgaris subsp. vulgaris]